MIYVGCGGLNVLITNPRDMGAFVGAIKDVGFTVMTGVNTLFAGQMMHPDFPETDFSRVKACINGGTTGHIGTAVPGTEIKLLDDEDQEVALGERGELVARGPQVTQGYYQRPDATKEAFTSDGFFQ